MSIALTVPPDGPLFDGHFPGRPLLAGVAQLALVARALAPAEGPAAVRSIPWLRFRGLVHPGDALEVSAADRGADGALRFDVRRAGAVVSNGAISFGIPAAVRDPGSLAPGCVPRVVAPFDELIPHRPPMRFVEEVLSEAEDGATCLCRVPHACALACGGTAPAFVALEAAAQTAAVWEALRRARREPHPAPRMGYLVAVRDATLYRETISADADLVASIRVEDLAPPLATYAVQVATGGAVALRGTIGTWLSA